MGIEDPRGGVQKAPLSLTGTTHFSSSTSLSDLGQARDRLGRRGALLSKGEALKRDV